MSDTRDKDGNLWSGRRKVRADATIKFNGTTYKVSEDLIGQFLSITRLNSGDGVYMRKGTYPKQTRVDAVVVT